jgi:hypothetical protein
MFKTMDEHYITFADEDEPETVLLKVFPSELRRKYVPKSTKETTRIGLHAVLVMALEYTKTAVIVTKDTPNGASIHVDAIPLILDRLDSVKITFMPANVTFTMHGGDWLPNRLERYIYFFYPNIKETNKFGMQDLIDAGPVYHTPNTPPVAIGMPIDVE